MWVRTFVIVVIVVVDHPSGPVLAHSDRVISVDGILFQFIFLRTFVPSHHNWAFGGRLVVIPLVFIALVRLTLAFVAGTLIMRQFFITSFIRGFVIPPFFRFRQLFGGGESLSLGQRSLQNGDFVHLLCVFGRCSAAHGAHLVPGPVHVGAVLAHPVLISVSASGFRRTRGQRDEFRGVAFTGEKVVLVAFFIVDVGSRTAT